MSEVNGDGGVAEATNSLAAAQIHMDHEAAAKAREHGWTEQTKYDYDALGAKPGEAAGTIDAPMWAANAQKYEWSDEYGDVGPEHEELEKQLFGQEHSVKKGQGYKKLAQIPVSFESKSRIKPIANFKEGGLHPIMVRNVELCGYDTPTPIQAYVIPSVLQGLDVIGIAQTGSGKTAAYLIPVLSKLMGKAKKLAAPRPNVTRGWTRDMAVRAEPLVLIIVPTRELAAQIFNEACRLCYRSMLRPCVIYGGAPTRDQIDELQKGCDILIGTPGRLVDFMTRGTWLSMNRVRYTIIDEADEMIHNDWQEEMDTILGGDANDDDDHVYMMFSATFPPQARKLAKTYLAKDHVRVRVGRAGSSHQNIQQNVIFVDDDKKRECIYDLLLSMPPTRIMVFVNNKRSADFLDDHLYNRGLPTTSIHSDRTQREREDAIRAFKTGKAPILITTGVSARGLDIMNVMHVINYDMPSCEYGGIDEYVHRIGRTARIGNVGMATSLYNERNEDIAEALAKLLKENNQGIPDFLQSYLPEGEELVFSDDSEKEEDKDGAGGEEGAAWGAGGGDADGPAGWDGGAADTAAAGWG